LESLATKIQDDGQPQKVRVLVVVNDPSSINWSLTFLERRSHQVQVVTNFKETLDAMESFKPHIILVSWNLKNVDVKKFYKFVTERFKLPCIAFAEDTSPTTSIALMSSGLPHHILAPVSGLNMHTKIDAVLTVNGKKNSLVPPALEKAVQVYMDEVPPDTSWAQVAIKSKDDGKNTLWRGSRANKSGPSGPSHDLYYFKGPRAPEYDSKLQKWKGAEQAKGPILMTERAHADLLSETQEKMESAVLEYYSKGEKEQKAIEIQKSHRMLSEPQIDWKSAVAEAKQALPSLEKSESPEESDQKETFSLLAAAVREALETSMGTNPARDGSADGLLCLQKAIAVTVHSNRFKGYLICANAADIHDTALVEAVSRRIWEIMEEKGEDIKVVPEIMNLDFDPINFLDHIQGRADFVITRGNSEKDVAFAFLPVKNLPKAEEALDAIGEAAGLKVLGVPFEGNFVGDTLLPFDLYLFLPKNNHFVLYVKKGTLITQKTINKLFNFGVKNVYVQETEKNLFFAYCAKNRLLSGVKS
jgi:CheY-like chemotaxis protein